LIKMRSTIINAALGSRRTVLTEPEAKALCNEYSIQTPEGQVARTQEQILMAASKLISEIDEVIELGLNPAIVDEKGAVVVDARIVLSQTSHERTASFYPPVD